MHESYLILFFTEMNKSFQNKWCILHSYETLPHYSKSDVDMAFSGTNVADLESLLVRVAKKTGWSIYQKLWYDVKNCYYYVLKENDSEVYLALDFLMDNDGIGRYGFTTKILTQDCVMYNSLFPVPNPEVAFCYKLVKRIEKQRSLEEDKEYLISQYSNSDALKVNEFLKGQFSAEGSRMIVEYLQESRSLTKKDLSFLKLQRKRNTSSVVSSLKYIQWETIRTCNRMLYPRGMQITVPPLKEKDLNLFLNLLNKKVDILFRFVDYSKSNSFWSSFSAMSGSTLLIIENHNFVGKNAIKYNWFASYSLSPSELKNVEGNVQKLSEVYYQAIIKVLPLKLPKKLMV